MYLNSLENLSLDTITFGAIACDCGTTHSFSTKSIIFESVAIERLDEIVIDFAVPLAKVLVIADASAKEQDALRCIEKKLARLGYRVACHVIESISASVDDAESIQINEDTKFILGVGGSIACDIAKYVAAKEGLEASFFITCPTAATRALTPSSLLMCGGLEEIYKTSVFCGVICDTDYLNNAKSENVAATVGELFSKFVALCDYKAASIIAKEPFCPCILRLGQQLLDSALKEFSAVAAVKVASLASYALRFSALSQICGNSRLISGADSQAAHVISILYNFEERDSISKGAAQLIFAKVINCIYHRFLGSNARFFTPPPDNNMRLSCIEEFLGISELVAIKKIRPLMEAKKLELNSYRLGEHRQDLFSLASLNNARLERAYKLFKSIYDDDGFWLKTAIDSSSTSLCVSLGADLKDKFTLLSHMKDLGLLDEYIKELSVQVI